MSQTFRFTQTINVDGKTFTAGDTIAREDVPEGCFMSLKRLKQIVEDTETPLDIARKVPVMAPPPPINPPVHAEPHHPAKHETHEAHEPYKQHPKRSK